MISDFPLSFSSRLSLSLEQNRNIVRARVQRGQALKPFYFEQGLVTLFASENGESLFTLLALAERAGLSQRIPDWLTRTPDGSVRTGFSLGWLGRQRIRDVVPFWEVLRAGSAREIKESVHALISRERRGTDIEPTLGDLIRPLALLERGEVAAELHDEALDQGVQITRQTSLTLAEAGDWDHVLAVLASGHRHDPDLSIGFAVQQRLWKHAYLDHVTETVLPRLAALPFDRKLAHAKQQRAWWLMVHQIRAGSTAVRVPVIEPDQQSPGYVEAAAIQIAALAGDSSQIKAVADLRRVLKPKTVSKTIRIDVPERGLSFSLERTPQQLFEAEVRIAARQKDYARVASLARLPSHDPFALASDIVIDALLEEGDWRGAAMIVAEHDPRQRTVMEGFDDDRLSEYQSLQLAMAAMAARSGEDAAAQTFLGHYALTYASDPRPDLDPLDLGAICPWSATALAGVAEGIVPRPLVALLLPLFRC
jgi:hypothetical protein